MAQLVFALKDVPEAEANAIRNLLEDNQIAFYETSAGRWNISVAALWLVKDEDYVQARLLIDHYQSELLQEQAASKADQAPVSLWQAIAERPFTSLVFITAAAIVVALSIVPFIRFG